MHATLRADAHVATGRVWPPGPSSNAHMNPLKAATPPVLASPVLASPALAGPALAGPVLAGPVLAGPAPERGLRGRSSECETLDRLVENVRAGQSQVLVLRGEAGAGKTALLEYLLERASGCCLARAAGVESEMELAFAALHQLCAPFLDRLERLPGPQRDALSTAFNLREGVTPDRFAVGLAVLSLLSEVAGERPLVCVVDDAHWLDPASARALAFVARHLAAKPAAVVFAHESDDEQNLTGLAELVVRGLADGDARALLSSAVAGPLDERVRDRIVAETRGNPLALLEVARRLTPEELAGGFGSSGDPAPSSRIEESFRGRLTPLPPATRLLLLVAAAEPLWDPVLVWRAAGQLGVKVEAAAAAAAAGLIEFGGQVRFRHPLVRSAVYRAASPEERQSAHRALAEAIDPDSDPDRRAWHRAHATPGLDEGVAAELERSVGRGRVRGGLAAAAAFCERAAELTPEPGRRAVRALAAAQAKHRAGAPDAALRLLAMAQAAPLDELGRARAELLRAQLTADPGRGRDASALLLNAARRLEPLHLGLARDAYRDAFGAALTAGRLAIGGGMPEVAAAARVAVGTAATCFRSAAGWTSRPGYRGYAAGAPILARALAAFRPEEVSTEEVSTEEVSPEEVSPEEVSPEEVSPEEVHTEEELRWLPLACRVSHHVWDDESWYLQPERGIGALNRLAETTRAAGTDWALGIQARSRALLSDGESAERLYREAIERLGRTRVRVELARAHLLYGEWLRRESRRVDAREQLRTAHQMLTAMGIEGFAERARRELLSTGETVRKYTAETARELTAQEAQIARLAGDGHTNPEIGVQLFISARTVEWHLRKVFTKLGVSSRKELRRLLPDLERAGVLV